jgi:hypothetical protein
MEAKEIQDIVENVKNKPNQKLIECRDILSSEFEKTKELIIDLTKHLDAVKDSYEIINEEIGKRFE